ncbi:exo-alpha-sialidase [Proteus mirabilis]|uniref:sialidase family protein n=1 Tax=Proteus mirabilis TaxID=584 RepID=UPI0018C7F362|nr:exo-alpha-sialidase [Proteus mirabilis]MBG2927807.1 exo-alpha-sialidase [Proteus mirabilis]MBI6252268.1 exo-alpha-sialidase [Proteus mirabilis]MBI6288584.1 exo-alpha-sialidase [Proteus mirabilis]MDC5896335.1 exo-alpha-sialidase [Proteus mirabilis]MDC5917470.1 exo-alpha-sialidase [Proteus mirabilis]
MPFVMKETQFVLDNAHSLFNHCHASTIVRVPNSERLLTAFFAGDKEGSGNTAIWLAIKEGNDWQPAQPVVKNLGVAHWNPVLHVDPSTGNIWLFYKTGPDVHSWTTQYVISKDGGNSWSLPSELVSGDVTPRGPVKNKVLVMSNGEWLAPGSVEDDRYWDAFVDISSDNGQHWQRVDIPIAHHQGGQAEHEIWQGLKDDALWETDLQRVFQWDGVIQPTLWGSQPGHVHAMMRSTRGKIYRSDSTDYGRSWCPAYATTLPNNNSGIDVVSFADGLLALVYNPNSGNWSRRYPISVSLSSDNGSTWSEPFDLLDGEGEFSYPAIIAENNTLHVTFTWNRKNIVYQQLIATQ